MIQTEQKESRPKLPIFRQLRTALIGLFVVLAVLPLAFIAWLLIGQATAQAEDQAFRQLDSVAELKTDQIDQFINEGDAAAESILADPQRHADIIRALT